MFPHSAALHHPAEMKFMSFTVIRGLYQCQLAVIVLIRAPVFTCCLSTSVLQLLAVFMRMDTRLLLTTYISQPHKQSHWLTFSALLVRLTKSLCVYTFQECV